MTYATLALWIVGSVIAFYALKRCALRDFGEITVGGLIMLLAASAIAPVGLLMAITLMLCGGTGDGFFGRVVWSERDDA